MACGARATLWSRRTPARRRGALTSPMALAAGLMALSVALGGCASGFSEAEGCPVKPAELAEATNKAAKDLTEADPIELSDSTEDVAASCMYTGTAEDEYLNETRDLTIVVDRLTKDEADNAVDDLRTSASELNPIETDGIVAVGTEAVGPVADGFVWVQFDSGSPATEYLRATLVVKALQELEQ